MTTISPSFRSPCVPRGGEGHARLHHRFNRQASLSPQAVALMHRGTRITYRELDERSNRIAHLLRRHGVETGMLAGLCLERGPDLVAALLGCFKAAIGVVPLDPTHPRERLAAIIEDCGAAAVIAATNPGSGRCITLDEVALAALPCTAIAVDHADSAGDEADAVACVFYTSGSSGRPKGVMLGHTAVNYLSWAEQLFTAGELDRVAATTSACFDPFLFEVLAPLGVGGTIILKRDLLEPFGDEEQPTLLNGVPSAFAELVREHRIPGSVRAINVGGERLSGSLAQLIHACAPGARLWNHYGPTEATICASVSEVRPGDVGEPTIGRPIAGAVFHVLDDSLQPVATGRRGELFIGGPNLALGYLNRPDLTAAGFVPDPADANRRLYRTGDMVRIAPDGAVVFLGREGRQIKFRGYRIELDEIEAAVARLPGVDMAAVLAICDARGAVTALRAAIVPVGADNGPWTLPYLRRALRNSLPRHMLPNRLVLLEAMPLTPNGKIDRTALGQVPEPEPTPLEQPDPWLPPWTEAILTIFRDVLDQPSLGPDDDFFDHGGDSLMAADVMLRIEALFGLQGAAPLTSHAGSAAALSGLLARQTIAGSETPDGTAPGRVVPLSATGGAPTLFCLADSTDRPLQALPLAVRLKADRPVVALASGAPLVSDHLATLRNRAPGTPALLLASGNAAPAAMALAAALDADGSAVVLVLVSPCPASAPAVPARSGWQRFRRTLRGLMTGNDARTAPTFNGRMVVVTGNNAMGSMMEPTSPGMERITLAAEDGTLLREPGVALLAELLRSRLPGEGTGLQPEHHLRSLTMPVAS